MISNTARGASQTPQPSAKPDERPTIVPNPPRPHRWFLVLTIVMLATWMVFLAYMALRPT